MIEQKAIYEAAQTAFEAHHPKFPWPKKNNLDEQTDEFKKAFLVFSTEVNSMHDREVKSMVEELNAYRTRLTEEINAGASARDKARIQRNRADDAEDSLRSMRTSATFGWCIAAVACLVVFLMAVN